MTVSVPATSANLGPGFDCLGVALELADTLVGEVVADGLDLEVEGEGAEEVPRDERHLVVRSMRAAFAEMGGRARGPAAALHQPDPAQPGAGLVVGRDRRRHRAGAGAGRRRTTLLDDAAALALANRIEGHPDNVAPALLGGFVISGQAADVVWAQPAPVDPSIVGVVFVPPHGVRTEVARGLLPEHGPTRRRRRQQRSRGAAGRGARRAPEQLLRATEDFLHQQQRRPAMPESLDLVDDLRSRGHRGGRLGRGTDRPGPRHRGRRGGRGDVLRRAGAASSRCSVGAARPC